MCMCTMSCMQAQAETTVCAPQKLQRVWPIQVDLRVPASGRFSQLDPSLAGIEDDLGEAIDQTAGFTDPDMALIIALKWNLLNCAAEEMSETWHEQRQQRTAAMQQQALAILKDKHDALKAATELQGQIKVGSSGAWRVHRYHCRRLATVCHPLYLHTSSMQTAAQDQSPCLAVAQAAPTC